MHIIVSVRSYQRLKCLEMTPFIEETELIYMYSQAQVTLHFGQRRKLSFNKIGCQKYDAPIHFHKVLLLKCVKRFNLNLLLWVGQKVVDALHKKSPENCSDI